MVTSEGPERSSPVTSSSGIGFGDTVGTSIATVDARGGAEGVLGERVPDGTGMSGVAADSAEDPVTVGTGATLGAPTGSVEGLDNGTEETAGPAVGDTGDCE